MKLSISITTYNRPEGLQNLLTFLSMQKHPDLEMDVLIVDDYSTEDYSSVFNDIKNSDMKIEFRVMDHNHGKENHWKIMNEVFRWYRSQSFDYALHIQDDVEIDVDFITRIITIFQAIPHPEKACLNFLYDKERASRANWTPRKPEIIPINPHRILKTGWVDLNFLANRSFFRFLGWKIHPVNPIRWELNPYLSSGVGKQISTRLFLKKAGMYMVTSTQAGHGSYESEMNPGSRKINPLNIKR